MNLEATTKQLSGNIGRRTLSLGSPSALLQVASTSPEGAGTLTKSHDFLTTQGTLPDHTLDESEEMISDLIYKAVGLTQSEQGMKTSEGGYKA